MLRAISNHASCWLEYKPLAVRTAQYGNMLITYFKRDEVMMEWRKLHNEELHALHCLTNIVRTIE
jgi:hypothetical protein